MAMTLAKFVSKRVDFLESSVKFVKLSIQQQFNSKFKSLCFSWGAIVLLHPKLFAIALITSQTAASIIPNFLCYR